MRKFLAGIDELLTLLIVIIPGALVVLFMGPLMLFASLEMANDAQHKPSLAEANAQRAQIGQWPHVVGHLDEIDIHAHYYTSSARGVSHWDYFPTARYSYKIGDGEYKATRIFEPMIDSDRRRYEIHDDSNALEKTKAKLGVFLPAGAAMQKKDLGEHDTVYTFFPNIDVNVFFDPANPANAMLDNQLPPMTWWQYYGDDVAASVFSAFIGVLFTGMVVSAMVAAISHKKGVKSAKWRATLATSNPAKPKTQMPKPIAADQQWRIEKPIS